MNSFFEPSSFAKALRPPERNTRKAPSFNSYRKPSCNTVQSAARFQNDSIHSTLSWIVFHGDLWTGKGEGREGGGAKVLGRSVKVTGPLTASWSDVISCEERRAPLFRSSVVHWDTLQCTC